MLIVRNSLEHYAPLPLTMVTLNAGESHRFSFLLQEAEKQWTGYRLKSEVQYVCHLTNQRLILEPTISAAQEALSKTAIGLALSLFGQNGAYQIPFEAVKSLKARRSLNRLTVVKISFQPTAQIPAAELVFGVSADAKSNGLPFEPEHCAADLATLSNELFQRDDRLIPQVQDSPVPVVVNFWAKDCKPCELFAPTVAEVAEQFGEQIKLIKVDMEEDMHLPMRYGVDGVPTVLIFKEGRVVDRITGAIPTRLLTKVLQQYL